LWYSITGYAVVVQQNEEDDCGWYVDEGVDQVDAGHESWKLEEPALYLGLEENVELLLEMGKLQGMSSCCMYSSLNQSHSGEGAAELIDLLKL